jgi:hypothetical protein
MYSSRPAEKRSGTGRDTHAAAFTGDLPPHRINENHAIAARARYPIAREA